MKFYRLGQSLVPKIIGKYPPFETGYFPVDAKDERLILNIFYEKVKEHEVFVPVPKLRKGSKLTDFMPGSTAREIISERLKKLIESTNPLGIQFLPQTIISNNVELDGFWLTNNYKFDYSVIDFSNTDISIMKGVWDIDYTIKVKSESEFLRLLEEITYPKRIKIFKPYFIDNYLRDFFALRHVYNGFSFFCSERFREKLEEEKITGIRFMELDEIL